MILPVWFVRVLVTPEASHDIGGALQHCPGGPIGPIVVVLVDTVTAPVGAGPVGPTGSTFC